VQGELLAQRVAKLVVIVDDEDFAGVAHRRSLGFNREAICKRVHAAGQAMSQRLTRAEKAHGHEG
jgi:hypothetical protein